MIKRKFLLLFLVGALTAASTFVVQTKNSNALQPGSVVTQEAEQLPEHVQYKFLFHHIRVLKEQADEIERQGKGRSGLLSRFEEDLGIEGPHFQRLTQVALDCERKITGIDQRAKAVIDEFRARYPEGKIPEGQELPPPPPALMALQEEHDATILEARDSTRRILGEQEFGRVDAFVKNNIAANVKRGGRN